MMGLCENAQRKTGASYVGSGFTLFEVAISLALVSIGVLSVLMLFPQGIKAEELARMRIVAGMKAQEIIDSFATSANQNSSTETEAPEAWNVGAGYRAFSADLESRINSHRYGIMPVPLDIARRLDSENDEIAQILAEGGQLFYSQASGATGLEEATLGNATLQPDALTQRLVFAVAGYAQHNHLSFLPQKAWPYYAPYPSPPGHGEKKDRNHPTDAFKFTYLGIPIAVWEGVGTGGVDTGQGTTDGDMRSVFESKDSKGNRCGYRPYALGGSNNEIGAIRYLQTALLYVSKKGIGGDWYAPPEPLNFHTKVAERIAIFKGLAETERWKFVQAFRFLSHAATCLTRWKNLEELGGQPSSNVGFQIESEIFETGDTSPALMLTHDKIVYYHELCLQMSMLYSASQPYDWGAPRVTQRALFTDHPLIEYDLFSAPNTGLIANTSVQAAQWKPIAARPITNIGRSFDFPNSIIPATLWGDPSHFTLTRKFSAEERCRQLVFWSVDWKSYEDFETAPSGPIDASKYQIAPYGTSFSDRMNGSSWIDHHVYQLRSPEKVIAFTSAQVPTLPTGANVANKRILNQDGVSGTDKGMGMDSRRRFLGRWGADRNFNGLLDRGPLPKSIRLRASSVARYNFYDPRLTLKLR